MYTATTQSIRVTVTPDYLEDESEPSENYFAWAYTVEVENHSEEVVQLISRYWRITDAVGRIKEIRGAGVVGEQPILEPGDAFEYTSWTPLETVSGIMTGSYQMKSHDGQQFDIEIPAFSLDSPYEVKRLN